MVKTPAGKYASRHFRVRAGGSKAGWDYHVWLSDRLPFGTVAFEVWHYSEPGGAAPRKYRAEVVRSGKGATSRIPLPK